MPFTLAHPAAAVPFARRGLVLSALVVGSLTPDFEYMIRLSPISEVSHTIPGLFLFCLPVGLVALWVLRAIWKRPLLELLPSALQSRIHPLCRSFPFGPPRRFAAIVVSILLGAATHVIWDSFTHCYGWAVRPFGALTVPLLHTTCGPLRLYKVLQHASTVVGLTVLLWLFWRWYRQAPAQSGNHEPRLQPSTRIAVVAIIVVSVSVLATAFALAKVQHITTFDSFRLFVVFITVGGLSLLTVELTIFSLAWHLALSRAKRKGLPQELGGTGPRGGAE